MKKITQMLFLLSVTLTTLGQTPHVIVCTFELYPELPQSKNTTTAHKQSATLSNRSSATKPSSQKASTKTFANKPSTELSTTSSWAINPPQIQGIYGTYFGYLDSSSKAGQLVFPRKHQDDSFVLVVAPKITPIFMIQNTIQTFQVPDSVSYKAYDITKGKDARTGLYYWDIKSSELPTSRALPLNAITIVADPSELYVPTGITVTENSPQLCLPPFYVKKTINLGMRALTVLDIRCFFESISRTFKTQGSDIQSKMS